MISFKTTQYLISSTLTELSQVHEDASLTLAVYIFYVIFIAVVALILLALKPITHRCRS